MLLSLSGFWASVMLCYVMLCYVMLCYAMLYYVTIEPKNYIPFSPGFAVQPGLLYYRPRCLLKGSPKTRGPKDHVSIRIPETMVSGILLVFGHCGQKAGSLRVFVCM